jgi:DNA (cytosine-5)-methyltransferase 1
MARIIREVGPRYAFVENSPMLTSRGLGRVLGDLAAMGYDARWGVLGAVDAGAPHKRDRIWIVGYANGIDRRERTGRKDGKKASHSSSNAADAANDWAGRWEQQSQRSESPKDVADANVPQREGVRCAIGDDLEHADSNASSAWWRGDPAEASESGVGRMAHGVAARVDRLKAIGNGQVPSVAALAWRLLN